HQIQNDLLQLHPITQNTRQISSQFHPQHHAIFLYFTLYQANNLLNGFVDVQGEACSVPFFLTRARIRPITSPARFPSLIMRSTASRASSRFGVPPASHRKQALALVTTAASG